MERDGAAPPPEDELRLALVLNGGVSLAIWMSGVVTEIDALRASDQPPLKDDTTLLLYSDLLGVLGLKVRVDVIAGTSAGGLNGAVLGTAIARGHRLQGLRDLWLESGSLANLIRKSRPGPALSLLVGDRAGDQPGLLTPVEEIVKQHCETLGPIPRSPVRMTMTTTDVYGIYENDFRDSYGNQADRIEHRLRFRFASDTEIVPDTAGIDESSICAIARAARSSSSFPFAFEPSKIEAGGRITAALHTKDGTPVFPRGGEKRFAVDGGVLDNSPIDVVLDDIGHLPARERPTRRAIIFVVPYFGHDQPAKVPDHVGLKEVASTTWQLPRDVPDLDNLNLMADRLADHHRRMLSYEQLLATVASANLAALTSEPIDPATATSAEVRRIGRRILSQVRRSRAAQAIAAGGGGSLRGVQLSVQAAIADARESANPSVQLLQLAGAQIALQSSGRDTAAVATELLVVDRVLHSAAGFHASDDQQDLGFTFMRLCADATHPGAVPGPTATKRRTNPGSKLYGLQLGHFASFVRRSWRANDWMFGRLDGCARLVDVLIDPRRLHEKPCTRADMRTALGISSKNDPLVRFVSHACMTDPALSGNVPDVVQILADSPGDVPIEPGETFAQQVTDAAGDQPIADVPSRELLVWRHAWRIALQLRVLRSELAGVATAVAADTRARFRDNPSPRTPDESAEDREWLDAFGEYAAALNAGGGIAPRVAGEMASGPGKRIMDRGIREASRLVAYKQNGMPWAVRAGAFPAVVAWRAYAAVKGWFSRGSRAVGP